MIFWSWNMGLERVQCTRFLPCIQMTQVWFLALHMVPRACQKWSEVRAKKKPWTQHYVCSLLLTLLPPPRQFLIICLLSPLKGNWFGGHTWKCSDLLLVLCSGITPSRQAQWMIWEAGDQLRVAASEASTLLAISSAQCSLNKIKPHTTWLKKSK